MNEQARIGFDRRTTRIGAEEYIYEIYTPRVFAKEEKPPVIVFLHGIRERGTNGFVSASGAFALLLNQFLNRIPAIILFPQCRPGKYWSDAEMEEMVMREIAETVAEFDAAAGRVYLLGVSMGGYGAWHFAARYPEKFAALVSICGGSPILTGDRFAPIAEKVKDIPAWVFHGADDTVVPVTESRSLVAALQAAGGKVRYSEYPRVGHNVWLQALGEKDLMPWLLAQESAEKNLKYS